MPPLVKDDIIKFIEPGIELFHHRRLNNILELRLDKILQRKNPYLFKAKNLSLAQDLIKCLIDAHLSSQEEGIFGGFLEELAVFICNRVYNGRKSSAEGIDLEFERDNIKYLITIKSGPHWGNSRQIARMKDDFRKAQKILRTNNAGMQTMMINGCCYGRDDQPEKGDYRKLCGQRFGEFISGDENLYIEIIEPLGYRAKEKNEQFFTEYDKVINKFTLSFVQKFCAENGAILWDKLVQFNSAKKIASKS